MMKATTMTSTASRQENWSWRKRSYQFMRALRAQLRVARATRHSLPPLLDGDENAKEVHRLNAQRIEYTEKMVCRYQMRLIYVGRSALNPTGLYLGEFWEQQMVGEKDIDLDQKSGLLDRGDEVPK